MHSAGEHRLALVGVGGHVRETILLHSNMRIETGLHLYASPGSVECAIYRIPESFLEEVMADSLRSGHWETRSWWKGLM